MTVKEFNELGEELLRLLTLRFSPIALKVLHDESEIPANSKRPLKDMGIHIAMCQAYAAVRRDRKCLTMLKEDHWCVWPLVSYGICKIPEQDIDDVGSKFFIKDPAKSVEYFKNHYPKLKDSEGVIGFTLAPLEKAEFVPDIITVYCRPSQIRSLQMAAKFHNGQMIETALDPVDSCVHSSIPVLNGQNYNITFPDPGEYERAMAAEDEVMFTMRAERLPEVVEALQFLAKASFGFQQLSMTMPHDFPRPQFYEDLFETWGLDRGEIWTKGNED